MLGVLFWLATFSCMIVMLLDTLMFYEKLCRNCCNEKLVIQIVDECGCQLNNKPTN
jgi:hypothetical protein